VVEIRITIRLLPIHRVAIKGVEQGTDLQVERLKSVPGMGTTLALTILGHSGNFSRFANQDAYAAYCGLALAV